MRTNVLVALALWVLAWSVPVAQGPVSYPVVYVAAPSHDNTRFADVFAPANLEPNSDLHIQYPDGRNEVLVDAGEIGAVADPFVMFDGLRVVYSYCPNVRDRTDAVQFTPATGCDLWIVDVATKATTQLTHGEFEPNTNPLLNVSRPLPVFNMGPTPVSGGKIAFTSNRHGFVPPKGFGQFTSQLFVMNEDGSDVHFIGALNVSNALHPFQLKDGRICWSTQESQGWRDGRGWGIWCSKPDGRAWEPLVSAFGFDQAAHFATELTNGDVVYEWYYNLNNWGFGSFTTIPLSARTVSAASFGPADASLNPPMNLRDQCGRLLEGASAQRLPFTWLGSFRTTPFSTPTDNASGLRTIDLCGTPEQLTAPRYGKVTHPQAGPGNDLLMAYSPGAVNSLPRPINQAPRSGIYVAKNVTVIDSPDQLVRVVDDPTVNELWPRPLLPYAAIYGVPQPALEPFLPNDGTLHPTLPAGTPYAIVRSSSLCNRESFPGSWFAQTTIRAGLHRDGLEPFNSPDAANSNWGFQGSDTKIFRCEDIAAIRLVLQEPTTYANKAWRVIGANERMRVLGEIAVRKTNPDGTPIIDSDGNADTSFSARIPADTPFTFQLLDSRGTMLTMAQTWHQARPGEVLTGCNGCHRHSGASTPWEPTAAAKVPPVDLLMPAHDVEYKRDIDPIITAKCVTCHTGDPAQAPGQLAFPSTVYDRWARLVEDTDGKFGIRPPAGQPSWRQLNRSRYVRVPVSNGSLLVWKLAGQRLDGWTNERWPGVPPAGANPATWALHMTDLDFEVGTVNHAAMVTPEELKKVITWIDLFAPFDSFEKGQYFADENRPTLTAQLVDGRVVIGAADAYSGLDPPTLAVTVNGSPVTVDALGEGRWRGPAVTGATRVQATVKDRGGNTARITRTLTSGTQPPQPPTPADCVITALRGAETVTIVIRQVLACVITP